MKGNTLKRKYKRFNRSYFNGWLPINATVRFNDIGDDVFALCSPWEGEGDIEINNGLDRDNIMGSLLHECLHLWQYHVEDNPLETEETHHDIEFMFHAMYIYELTGYPIV